MSDEPKTQKSPHENSEHAAFAFVLDDGSKIPAHRHHNPDGTIGGWVAASAIVDKTSVIHEYAFVWPNAVVRPGQEISGNWFDDGEFPKLSLG